jgi:hypothetical protein
MSWVSSECDSGDRLIMLQVGGINAQLVFRPGSSTGDYHGQMNSANFEKWVVEKLVPNLPPHALIVLDNAPCLYIRFDKSPSPHALISDVISRFHNRGIDCNVTMHKDSLYKLIVPLKPKEKAFRIDYGRCSAASLHVCDLNLTEIVWTKVREQ